MARRTVQPVVKPLDIPNFKSHKVKFELENTRDDLVHQMKVNTIFIIICTLLMCVAVGFFIIALITFIKIALG